MTLQWWQWQWEERKVKMVKELRQLGIGLFDQFIKLKQTGTITDYCRNSYYGNSD
jgi:hypothetical protein